MSMIKQFIEAKSDQWNATDFVGGPRTFTIESVKVSMGQDQPVSIKLQGEPKVWRCCKTTARLMVSAWGEDEAGWSGKSATLFCDPAVRFGAIDTGGIRISHMSHLDKPLKLALPVSRGKMAVFTVQPLRDTPKKSPKTTMTAADAIASINAANTLDALQSAFGDIYRNHRAIADDPAVIAAKDARKSALQPAPDTPTDDEDIPL